MQPLPFSLTWQKTDTYTFLPVFMSVVLFEIYWFTAKSAKIKAFFYKRLEYDQASAYHITFLRLFGFVSMGLGSGIISMIFMPDYSLSGYGLTYIDESAFFSVTWTIGLMLIIIPIAYFSARKPRNLVNYPQIRARIWTSKIVFMNAFGWFMYLFGYEFLFRGVLLFPLAEHLGVWPAVAISIAICSAAHIPKGFDETIGSIILGFVFCVLTLESGTIWIAVFVHVALAWTNGFTALRYHPDMQYLRSEKLVRTGFRENA